MPESRARLLRAALLRIALFWALLGLGAWPWQSVRVGFSHALSGLANASLGRLELVPSAHIELVPLPATLARGPRENVRSDTEVVLRVDGRPGEARIGLSLRRDAYLPLLIFVATLIVLPLGARRKWASLGLGAALTLAVALASVASLVLFLTSRAPGAGVPEWQAELASLIFDCWLTPPGNRVIAPLLLALGFALNGRTGAWSYAPQSPADATS